LSAVSQFKGDIHAKKDKIKYKVKRTKTDTERVGPNDTMCNYGTCRKKCHLNCGYGDGEDKK
jgi:hypothetical protein